MRRILRAPLFLAAAPAAAVSLYFVLTLPPAAMRLEGAMPPTHLTGAYHVHSIRSDGTGTVEAIARAARDAGLDFVILTDHGDATRPPDAPRRVDGVLVIDGVEINTENGHLVALGLTRASPYPLAGAARDVVDDVHRMGGIAIAAHPDSPRENLRWRGSTAGLDGVEWLNADSEWRDERTWPLVATAFRSLLRPAESIASLFDRPARSLARWDGAARERPAIGLAAVDAHANISWREAEEPRQRTALARPSYASMFRTVTQTVVLESPPTGEAGADATALLTAIARGRTYSTIAAYAAPAEISFEAEQGSARAMMGGNLDHAGLPTRFRARVAQAPGVELVLLHEGREIAKVRGSLDRSIPSVSAGAYRVEARWPGRPAPWIVTNPIAVGQRDLVTRGEGSASPEEYQELPLATGWRVEKSSSSAAGFGHSASEGLHFSYTLGPGAPSGQYAGIVTDVPAGDAGAAAIRMTARASRPMRVSLQVRLPGGGSGERWRRSIYLDETERTIRVGLNELEPVDQSTTRRPNASPVLAVLLVADTLNATPGTEGAIWISRLGLDVYRP